MLMKKTMFKRFAVIFSILLVFSNLSFLQPQIGYAQAPDDGVEVKQDEKITGENEVQEEKPSEDPSKDNTNKEKGNQDELKGENETTGKPNSAAQGTSSTNTVKTVQQAESITLSVVGDDQKGQIIAPSDVSITEEDTVLSVLKEAAADNGVSVTIRGEGSTAYVVDIDGLAEFDRGPLSGWTVKKNGSFISKSAGITDVKDGDEIEWVYTEDYTKDTGLEAVSLEVKDKNGNNVISEPNVTMFEGSNAYNLLETVTDQEGVVLEASYDEEYDSYFINTIGQATPQGSDFWGFYVNGSSAATGASSYDLESGDQIVFKVDTFESEDDGSTDGESEDETEPSNGTASEQPEENTDQPEYDLPRLIAGLVDHIKQNGVDTEWEAVGLYQTGATIPDSYLDSVIEELKENDATYNKITDLERLTLGILAAGGDPVGIAGYNLIEKIYNSDYCELGDYSCKMTRQGTNGVIFALIALDSADYEVPESANWSRDILVDRLIELQADNGGWGLVPESPTVDITAMALPALAPYQDQPEVDKAINEAVKWLSDQQEDSGGYFESFLGETSESTAQVIIGLSTIGVDPTSEKFTKKNGNLIDHLLSFQRDDGGFNHTKGEDQPANGKATEQALHALTAYQNYLNGKGSIYLFPNDSNNDGGLKPENPEDEEQEPEDPSKGDEEEQQEDESGTPETPENPSQDTETEVKPTANIDSATKTMTVAVELNDIQKLGKNETLVVTPEQSSEQLVLEIALKNDVIKTLVQQKNELKINKGDVALQLPTVVLEQFVSEGENQPIKIKLEKQESSNALGPVYDFTITVGSKEISDFNGHNVTLNLQVNPKLVEGLNPDEIKAFYFNEETNEWEVIENSFYDGSNGIVTANTTHFSTFGVFKEDHNVNQSLPTVANVSDNNDKNGKSANISGPSSQNQSPGGKELPDTATNLYNYLLLGIVLLLIGAGFYLYDRRRKA